MMTKKCSASIVFVDMTSRNKHDEAIAEIYAHYFPNARVLLANRGRSQSPLHRIAVHFRRCYEMLRADQLHFFAGKGPVPLPSRATWLEPARYIGLRLLKWAGKSIYLHYQGCDLRYFREDRPKVCGDCPMQQNYCMPPQVKKRQRAITQALRYTDAVFVSTPDLMQYVPKSNLPVIWLPKILPESTLRVISQARKKASNKPPALRNKIRFIHAPSSRTIKGTDRVIKAIETLQGRGNNVELVMVEGATRDELFAQAARCDIALDQFNIGFYGTFCVEMLALGLPVCVKIDDDVMPTLENVARLNRLPILNSGKDYALVDTLNTAIYNFDKVMKQFNETGEAFVKNVHSIESSQILKIANILNKKI